LFWVGYGCILGLVLAALLAVSETPPLKCAEAFDGCRAIPPTLDEAAIKNKWDRALQHLGM
jgi:hypothetical protein